MIGALAARRILSRRVGPFGARAGRLPIALVLLSALATCQSTGVQALEGAPAPHDEIAFISAPDANIQIDAIDGKDVDGERLEIPAGRHRVRAVVSHSGPAFLCSEDPTLLICGDFPGGNPSPATVEFEAEAGHRYHVTGQFLPGDDGRETVHLEVSEVDTGGTVGRAER